MKTLIPRLVAAVTCALAFSPLVVAAQEGAALVASTNADGVQQVRIIGGDYYFEPRHVVVKANVPVELLLVKEAGVVPHSFVIDAPEAGISVNEDLSTDGSRVRFTPTAPGRYAYYCHNKLLFFKSHRERGMEGVLEVVP